MAHTLGVLVAGGRGRRLGLGLPKALVSLGGTTLLDRARATLAAVCDETVIVTRPGVDLPATGAIRVEDPPGSEGPLAGMVAGLAARPHQRAVVLAVDLPLVPAALLAALLDRLEGHAAVVPVPGGRPQPLAAAYDARAAAALAGRLAAGERAAVAAVLTLAPRLLDDTELARLQGGGGCFLNVNTPADLEQAARLVASAAAR